MLGVGNPASFNNTTLCKYTEFFHFIAPVRGLIIQPLTYLHHRFYLAGDVILSA